MITQASERVALLGASRGLGAAFFAELVQSSPKGEALLFSRNELLLQRLSETEELATNSEFKVSFKTADFSQTPDQEGVFERLRQFRPNRIFYFAGGGPFGPFEQKSWKDHQWALEVTFLFPARLLHLWMRGEILPPEGPPRQFVIAGSHVAEAQPDPLAASYAAAKHALRGLIQSIQEEAPNLDLRLFSPTYLDTKMLPKNAAPRLNGTPIIPVGQAAKSLHQWAYYETGPRHQIFNPR